MQPNLKSNRRELEEKLRKDGVTEVDFGIRRRAEYATDASNYRVIPAAVVFPRDCDEVQAVVRAAIEAQLPVTSRGAGTSVAGNAVGSGVIIDYSRHLNRVLSIDPGARTATVQPGASLDAVTAAASVSGLRFGPDPSTHATATVGGSLGNNACGARALTYGRCVDNVESLRFVTAQANLLDTASQGGAVGALSRELRRLAGTHEDMIRSEFGRFARQGSGYGLENLLAEGGPDIAKLLVGSEGTLATVTSATIKLAETPRHTALLVAGYADMPAAAAAVPSLLPFLPVALEGMDARLVQLARDRSRGRIPELPRGKGWLLVEVAGDSEVEAQATARRALTASGGLDGRVVVGPEAAALWRIRESGAGLIGRTPEGKPAWPGWEDAAVPVDSLPDYLRQFSDLLASFDLDGLTFGHFGDGCVHSRIDFPLRGRTDVFREFVRSAAELVNSFGGSMSGEHGDGRARSELLSVMYSQSALDAFAQIKHTFDPERVFNPGILVEPARLDEQLRVPAARSLPTVGGFALRHDGGDLSGAVHRCVGVGRCRVVSPQPGTVMCPSFQATGDEKDSTRGRARVLQELANGSLFDDFKAEEVSESLDLCLACKACSSDCPAGVDMATYKAEVLYRRYRGRVRPRSHYALGRLPQLLNLGTRLRRLTNVMLRRSRLASAAKWAAGVDPRRQLPVLAEQTFREWFAGHRPIEAGRPVLLWVDTFSNHFTPRVAIAAVTVLEAAGYEVQITKEPVCCGLTWISTGQLDGARRQLQASLDAIDPWTSQGVPIVGLEPSCTAVFRSDLGELLPNDARAARAAQQFRTFAELLSETDGWSIPSLAGRALVCQPHCHQHAVLGWDADKELLTNAGGVVDVVGGCCGLAGNFGMENGHYDISLQVAEQSLLPAVAEQPSATVLADGFSCRTQLDQLSDARGLHLAELIAGELADE